MYLHLRNEERALALAFLMLPLEITAHSKISGLIGRTQQQRGRPVYLQLGQQRLVLGFALLPLLLHTHTPQSVPTRCQHG